MRTMICISAALALSWGQEAPAAMDLVKASIDVSTPQTMVQTSRQVLRFPNGTEREFEIKSWSRGGNDDMLMRYQKPARVRGDSFLFLENGDIYAFFAATGRTRRIASSARKGTMQGSDFSYEDMTLYQSIETDFTAALDGDEKVQGRECYRVVLTPTADDISYEKLVSFIDKESRVMRRLEFYEDGTLVKYMEQDDFKERAGFLIPFHTVMVSTGKNTRTEIWLEDLEINPGLSDRLFDQRNLGRQ